MQALFEKNPYTTEEISKIVSDPSIRTNNSMIVTLDSGIQVFVFRTGHPLDNCTKGKPITMVIGNTTYTADQPETLFQLGKFICGSDKSVIDLKTFICKKAKEKTLFELQLKEAQKILSKNVVDDEEWKELPSFVRNTKCCDEILNLIYICKDKVKDSDSIASLFLQSNWSEKVGTGTTAWAGRFYGLGIDTKIWDVKRFEWMINVRCNWAEQCSSFEELKELSRNFTLKFAELQVGKSFKNQWMVSSTEIVKKEVDGEEKEIEVECGMNWLGTVYDIFFEKMKELGRIPKIEDFIFV
jgi:hypothetical protein